jgi:hypothetical protein
LPSRQPNLIHKAAAQDNLKVRARHLVPVGELAGKKVLVKHKTAARNKVRTRAGLNRARKAEMSSAASGNSPPVKTSGDRLKASGSAKAKAKPNEAKTGRSRKAGNETATSAGPTRTAGSTTAGPTGTRQA